MRCPTILLVGLSAAAVAGVAVPAAEAAQTRQRAPVLDLSAKGPSVAMRAAQAAQAATAQPGAARPLETATTAPAPIPAPADAVAGVTVTPQTQRPGKVVASTSAASLSSPNFSETDAQDKPLAVAIGDNTALGRKMVDNTPAAGGLLHNNPELQGSQPTRGDVGVATVF
ncbi:MAG TPA: hypothetical protein VL460_06650 [Caulobacteraceae bacterium]|jgi:hypothetical protein|nr:hypothetical protein [Caulobacteraceae bacterium]